MTHLEWRSTEPPRSPCLAGYWLEIADDLPRAQIDEDGVAKFPIPAEQRRTREVLDLIIYEDEHATEPLGIYVYRPYVIDVDVVQIEFRFKGVSVVAPV